MTVQEALNRKQSHRSDAYDRANALTLELHEHLPEIAAIDAQISMFPTKLMSLPKGAGRQSALDALKSEVAELGVRRRQLLIANGYSADYDSVKYECDVCKDTGSVDGHLCECIRKELATNCYNAGGIGKALQDKSFDNFSLDYYVGAEKDKMATVFEICKKYACNFSPDGQSLLLLGGTGLGKTHLSAAIAKQVISDGYTAYYETAPAIFEAYDSVRFGRKDAAVLEPYGSQLLLIDDLGSEATTQANAAVLFELINRRFLTGLSTVISTNLSPAEIKKRYSDRVYSRLLGEYKVLAFCGTDIRLQKIKNSL